MTDLGKKQIFWTCVWFLMLIVTVLVLFVDFFEFEIGGYAAQRFLLVGILAIGILAVVPAWVCVPGLFVHSSRFLVLCLPLIAALAFAGMSSVWLYSWVEPVMFGVWLLLPALLALWLSFDQSRWYIVTLIEAFVYALAVACFFYGAVAILFYTFALSDGNANMRLYIPWGFANMRFWSQVATWVLPILPLAALIGPFKKQRLWTISVSLVGALWWWMVLLSSARGTALGVGFGAILAVVLIGRPAMFWSKSLLRHFVLGVMMWLVLSIALPLLVVGDMPVAGIRADSSGRTPLFQEAWAMGIVNFPFGMGAQSWLTHEILTETYRQGKKLGHPHNMYLMWVAEYGWIFMLGLMLLVMAAIRKFWSQRESIKKGKISPLVFPLVAFTASVSAALVHAGVSAVFLAPGSMLIGFFVLTIFWVIICSEDSGSRGRLSVPYSPKRVFCSGVLFVLVIFFSASWVRGVWSYHQAMVIDVEHRQSNGGGALRPRFWLHGDFPRSSN